MSSSESEPVSDANLAAALAAYRPEARYLRAAHIGKLEGDGFVAEATGHFGIESSCYIADTGHFNSVEFNLCHAQLASVLLRDDRVRAILPGFAPDFGTIKVMTLRSVFRRAMSSADFSGRLTIRAAASHGEVVSVDTEVQFWVDADACCEGAVALQVPVA